MAIFQPCFHRGLSTGRWIHWKSQGTPAWTAATVATASSGAFGLWWFGQGHGTGAGWKRWHGSTAGILHRCTSQGPTWKKIVLVGRFWLGDHWRHSRHGIKEDLGPLVFHMYTKWGSQMFPGHGDCHGNSESCLAVRLDSETWPALGMSNRNPMIFHDIPMFSIDLSSLYHALPIQMVCLDFRGIPNFETKPWKELGTSLDVLLQRFLEIGTICGIRYLDWHTRPLKVEDVATRDVFMIFYVSVSAWRVLNNLDLLGLWVSLWGGRSTVDHSSRLRSSTFPGMSLACLCLAVFFRCPSLSGSIPPSGRGCRSLLFLKRNAIPWKRWLWATNAQPQLERMV